LRGVGLGYWRLLRVSYAFAIVLMAMNLAIVGFLQPYGRYAYDALKFELRSGALGASIKVGEFTNLGKRMTIRIERSENEGRLLHGVFVRAESKTGETLAITADQGRFMGTPDDPDEIILRLNNGRLIHNRPDFKVPRVLTFATHNLPIDLPAIASFRHRGGAGGDNDELTLPELIHFSGAKNRENIRAAARSNFHFRLVEVLMMLLMPLLAVALAVPPKRSSSGLGIFVAILMVVTYHKVNQYAEHMGAQGRIEPTVALWTPFVLFAGLIIWMYWTLAHKPGGQPIGALERAASKTGKFVTRILRLGSSRRGPMPAE
jgi:lipopolysaccharide export system permease protein